MAALAAFYSRIQPLIPNCPAPLLDQALVDSCVEFCEQGSAVHRELEVVQTTIGESRVELDLPAQSLLVRITALKINGRETVAKPYFEMDEDVQGLPRMFSNTPEGDLMLYPVPDAVYPVKAMALLKPVRNATAVDDILFQDWAEFIVSGAMYRLLMMPGVAWSNPTAGKMYFDNFRMGINRAEIEFTRQRNTNEMRVQYVHI
jgi:hypothetical protein